jgi:carboxyl-terminal processing protease
MMQNKKLQIWLPLLFSLTMILGMYFGYRMRDTMPGKKFFSLQKSTTIQEVSDLINNRYVDEVDRKALTDTAIEAILAKLDPHTVHIPASELEAANEDIQGNYVGIGIEYNIPNDSLQIIRVIKNGPSEKAGLLVGDIILKANDSLISGKKVTTETIRGLLRGPESSSVKLTLLRNAATKIINVKRGSINLPSVDAAYMLEPKVGYIKLTKFTTQTYKEFMNALLTLKKQNMTSLVLDLRDNGGGVLDEAVEIVDELLEGDKLITYTEGIHSPKKEYRCRRQGQFEQGKVILLANEGSASASEVVLGALQDWDRATIIGRRTFGKGLVQEQYDLSDKSALRLTIARYYTPLGRSIQRSYKTGSKKYYEEITERILGKDNVSADSVKLDSGFVFKTKAGKKLLGGMGINPEILMPQDSIFGENTRKLLEKNIVEDYAFKYYRQNTTALNKFNTSNQFCNEFEFTEADWQAFVSTAAKDSINLKNINAFEKQNLKTYLKASIGKQKFFTEGFVECMNKYDKTILKAIELAK